MGMNTALPIPGWACSRATGDGFIVAEALNVFTSGVFASCTECKVVGAALGSSTRLESFKDDISDPLGCKNVTANDGSTLRWSENRVGRDSDIDWLKAALV